MQFHSVTNITTESVWLEVYLAAFKKANIGVATVDVHSESARAANRAADAFDDRFDPSKKELGR